MSRIRPARALAARQGVILLVVITLLTLFAVVGITFVLYAQAEASSMRVARQGESLQHPDADPELLLSYYLNQLIYDTNNPQSSMRNWGLATNMYGQAGGTVPFNGVGRLQNGNYWNINYATNGRNPALDGAPNPPYTYPDVNSLFLAAVRAFDGAVLVPSFYRRGPNGPVTLRANLPFPPEDGVADVKNLADSPGFLHQKGNFTPNDSIWVDLGFPVMRGVDGRRFKPLFAALIQDLDNRVNLNAHGNCLSDISRNIAWCISHQGYSPGEVGLDAILTGPNWEVSHIFNGNNGTQGRYDQHVWPPGGWPYINQQYTPGGHFYSGTDIDCWDNVEQNCIVMPVASTGMAFPWYNESYSHSWWQGMDEGGAPTMYNYFDPTQNWYWNGGLQRCNDRRFPASDLEALYRYSDRGSPALTSDLFSLCPMSFQSNPSIRRLVTTLSMDLARPGVMPSMTAPQQGFTYQLAQNLGLPQQYPTRQPMNFPAPGALPSGEFGAGYHAMANAAAGLPLHNRIDLNRGFVDYPQLGGNFQFNNQAGFQPAMQSRQQMAQSIFNVLCTVTGASCTVNGQNSPVTVNVKPGQPEYDALRWLAQLAVNIVDFTDFPNVNRPPAPDDVMTMFNWNPAQSSSIQNGWVFGTVLPRLVVNEAYVEISNRQKQNDPGLMKTPPKATQYNVNCWVELHNPFSSDSGNGVCNNWQATPTPYNGTARLYVPAGNYGAYRLLIARTNQGGNNNATVMTQNNNVLGVPQNIRAIVSHYTPDKPTSNQKLLLNGDSLNQVQPINGNNNNNSRNNNVSTPMHNSAAGNNQGYYVLGPKESFPGTDKLGTFFATLPVKEQAQQQQDPTLNAGGVQNSMHYVYTPGGGQLNVQNLNHTVVLQRLACPYMPPNFTPTSPNFNPYVTVDYMLNVPANDAVNIDGNGPHQPTPVQQRYSVGRNQPYAADPTQQVQQLANYDATQLGTSTPSNPPPQAPASQQSPQNTFFCANMQGPKGQAAFAYDWLFWANRLLISPMELLHVSGYKPSQLTQMFVQGPNQNGVPSTQNKFLHRAPWYHSSPGIYRALEFFEAGLRPQWSPIGGRFTGRININTIWDPPTWQALCNQQPNNYFTAKAVTDMYGNMTKSRTPNGVPMVGDRPFLGMAAPYAAASQQYPIGANINDTFLRADPNPPPTNPQKRLFEVNYLQTSGEMRSNPVTNQPTDQIYYRNELMMKIFGNTTTRSNVFALWLTVGFFEVLNDMGNGPPTLGQEINKAEGRNVRHRMFAILDRTNLTIATTPQGQPLQPLQAGPRPFFINSLTPVTQPGRATTITVPASATNAYEEMTWNIQPGMPLVVDTGMNQEIVTAAGAVPGGQGLQITATFTKPHAKGFPVSNAVLGNPGPQTFFDPRNPQFSGIVRYFSIIE